MQSLPGKQQILPDKIVLTNENHRIFVEEYCTGSITGKKYNAVRAAEAAGYKNIKASAEQLKKRPDVRAAIDQRLRELTMTATEVLRRFSDMASAEVGDIYEVDPIFGRLRVKAAELERLKPYLKEVKYDRDGNQILKFHDQHEALRDLAKAFGMFKEGLEVSGPGGGPIGVVNLNLNFVKSE